MNSSCLAGQITTSPKMYTDKNDKSVNYFIIKIPDPIKSHESYYIHAITRDSADMPISKAYKKGDYIIFRGPLSLKKTINNELNITVNLAKIFLVKPR